MIKILILCAIIAATTAVGVLLSADKKKRAAVFAELYEFNERMLINLKFGKQRISQIAADFKYMPDILAGKSILGGDDGQFISQYIKNIGVSDSSSQIDYLNERKQAIKKRMEESGENYKKYSSLYIKMALMIGILIAVLLA
ncbi:MAG TPA: hypothetical protein IAB94_02405 [Candidatus Coproplasma avicola]|uniref:Stage III sporulation protein AB n=1 Tax=Candidatus Coproplasma avicola TaxID=2840744 RepID=A0A9D1E6B8_9FIRM|nr:hypothetical protein [Candidatus Coproplasma avicola]